MPKTDIKVGPCAWVVAIGKRINQINMELDDCTNPLRKCELESAKQWLKFILDDMHVSKEDNLIASILAD